jgi:hypothetical protein
MKNIASFFFYILLPAAFLVFLFWFGWGSNFGKKQNLVLKEIYAGDFGVISSQSPLLERNLTIVNKGKADVTISKIYTDCNCLSAVVPTGNYTFGPFAVPTEQNVKPLGIGIPAGGEMAVKLNFNLANLPPQKFSGNLFIEALGTGEVLSIPIKASIVKQ